MGAYFDGAKLDQAFIIWWTDSQEIFFLVKKKQEKKKKKKSRMAPFILRPAFIIIIIIVIFSVSTEPFSLHQGEGRQMQHNCHPCKCQHFHQDVGLELSDCWLSTIKALCMKPRPSLSG